MAVNNKKKDVTWDKDTDYQSIINDAVAKGDYKTAAQAEQSRNAKIKATGSNYATTNNYSSYLDKPSGGGGSGSTYSPYTNYSYDVNTDYGTLGKNQMASGASWQDVLNTYNKRKEKASTEAGLEQYENDAIQDEMWQYIMKNMQQPSFVYNEPAPTYEGKYDNGMDALLNQILNRDDFSYDVATDPLYQQYAQMYQREGDRAMRETMAEAAAGAGGMNSYAITAAQQANNYYNSQLNDKIPELYNIAYDKYLGEIEGKARDLGLLQNMDATQYNRYLATLNNWQNDRNFAYGMYRDDIADSQWNRNFDYNSYVDNRNFDYTQSRDNVYDTQWDKDFNATQSQIALENSWHDEENAKADVEFLVSLGVMPDDATISRAGLSRDVVALAVEEVKKKDTVSSGSKGGKGGKTNEDLIPLDPEPWKSGVADLGLPFAVDASMLVSLEDAGAIREENGELKWNSGWNAQNYRQKLSEAVSNKSIYELHSLIK